MQLALAPVLSMTGILRTPQPGTGSSETRSHYISESALPWNSGCFPVWSQTWVPPLSVSKCWGDKAQTTMLWEIFFLSLCFYPKFDCCCRKYLYDFNSLRSVRISLTTWDILVYAPWVPEQNVSWNFWMCCFITVLRSFCWWIWVLLIYVDFLSSYSIK